MQCTVGKSTQRRMSRYDWKESTGKIYVFWIIECWLNLVKILVMRSLDKPAASPAPAPIVPNAVAIMDQKTVFPSTSTTQDIKLIKKMNGLSPFFHFFSRPEYDRSGNIATLTPGQLTDEALELLATHSSTADQARALYDGLDALTIDISREFTHLSRTADLPYLSQTVITYMLQTHFFLHAIDKNHDSLKKSSNFLSFLPPPSSSNDDYSKYMNATRNVEVELLLDQPQEKRSAIKKMSSPKEDKRALTTSSPLS